MPKVPLPSQMPTQADEPSQYREASVWADKARDIDGSYASVLLSSKIANVRGENLQRTDPLDPQAAKLFGKAQDLVRSLVDYRFEGADAEFRLANHGLGLDKESRVAFEAILKDNPQDFSATLNLACVCSEYLFDTVCSYRWKKLVLSLDLRSLSPSDQVAMKLNAAEAAVLDRNYSEAGSWLNDPANLGAGAQYTAITDFCKLLIALAKKTPDLNKELDHLKQSLSNYAQTHKQSSFAESQWSWSFVGARHALVGSDLAPKARKLLSDIIGVFDDASSDILPSSCENKQSIGV